MERPADAFERRRHVRRLERAMATGRTWSAERFVREVVGHPELGALAARVLWWCGGAFVLADGRPIGLDGAPRPLGGPVGVAHPADLAADALRAWGEHFAVRHLRSPFDQLARPTRLPDDGHVLELSAFGVVDGTVVAAALEPRGWQPGEPDRRLRVSHLVRRFADDDPIAVLHLDPGLAAGAQTQRLAGVVFAATAPGGVSKEERGVALREVPRRLRSEVLYDLSLLPT